jgi:L-threonylcarbamoyladenylate synthase
MSISKAALALKQGKLVAFATETVYGLGADATNDLAVAGIFAAKERPKFNPLIVHVSSIEQAEAYGIFNTASRMLAAKFWPGALTMVLERKPQSGLSHLATAGLGTVAIRVPDNATALGMLREFGGPVAAPSANISGRLSPTEPEHVTDMLGNRLAVILDDGPCRLGIESTIINLADSMPVMLRPGAILKEDIATVLGQPLKVADNENNASPSAPGQMASHYAPRARLRLNSLTPQPGEMFLGFGPDTPAKVPGLNLSPAGDLVEAAANLFAYLHILDDTGCDAIAVMPIPASGMGLAINDRLHRAAAR